MYGRVRERLAPPGLSLASAVYWRPSCWHALCCHCLSTEWNLRGVAAGVSVCVITQSSLSLSNMELGLAFFVLGATPMSILVSFLFLLETLGRV